MYNKTIIRFSFCDIQKNQGLGKSYQPQPSALSNLDITKTSSNNCLFNEYVGRKMQENLYIEQKNIEESVGKTNVLATNEIV